MSKLIIGGVNIYQLRKIKQIITHLKLEMQCLLLGKIKDWLRNHGQKEHVLKLLNILTCFNP